ncbi:M15 family metallopeptidase [Algibacter sp. L4_22]|uniref:M15 family metallopeptidase n=1 Tax=Algibacter sp. L4_22 TaxID=2942477 RepID=UPI00201B5370|nr:M15 family metallopeptidase [Algibacter sp. L4_22]MCL5128023.1 M15 family metallopeptidase [Algibacter sp. L4_22]
MKKPLLYIFVVILTVLNSCKNEKPKQIVENLIVETIPVEIPKKTIDTMITKEFVLGKFDYRTHHAFQKVSVSHSSKTIYLNKKCYEAFIKMYNHAKADSIDLIIISGTRNFYEQKSIWERKWKKYASLKPKTRALKILEYSSMPTSSRHHWGTDMDLNNLNNSYFEKGEGLKIYNWLEKHAKTYGFSQVYTNKTGGRTGYNMEKWHWSFMPLAETYLEFYNNNISYTDITGFEGSEQAKEVDIIKNYVNGISKK